MTQQLLSGARCAGGEQSEAARSLVPLHRLRRLHAEVVSGMRVALHSICNMCWGVGWRGKGGGVLMVPRATVVDH